jgi:small GTP-binding protein
MIKKKVCMLGSFAVGKTSLVQRFVNSIFSEKYHTTIGVKIDQKQVTVDGQEVTLMLWDIHGEDEFQTIKPAYVMGTSGYFIVMDGTRGNTLEKGLQLRQMVENTAGKVPFIVLINKADLKSQWEITDDDLARLKAQGVRLLITSAKTGDGVEEAFVELTRDMLKN